jgi:hypothetical protein
MAALLIDVAAAVGAAFILALLLWVLTRRELESSFGDARRGFFYAAARRHLLRLATMPEDVKNWRPTILAFSGNPASRETLVTYAVWLESGRGIVMLANVVGKSLEVDAHSRALAQLKSFCQAKQVLAFPIVAVDDDLRRSVSLVLQTAMVGPIRPNLAMFGWPGRSDSFDAFAGLLRTAKTVGMSLLLIRDRGLPKGKARRRLDIWWRGRKNGELMVLLAHLLTRNWEWIGCELRVLRVVGDVPAVEAAEAELQLLVNEARVDAIAVAKVAGDRSFSEVLYETSSDASAVFLGFEVPIPGRERSWHARLDDTLKGLPTTIVVSAEGRASMLA